MQMKLSNSRKILLENAFALTALNALNLLLPLITSPYLLKTVGDAKYGIYSIVYAMIQFVLLVGQFGFKYTTTKEIAQNRDNLTLVSSIFHSTIVARFVLTTIASICCYALMLIFYPKYILLYLFGLGIVYGDILNPVWLFQGMEKMRYMTIVNSITKILFTVLIFTYIKEESDYIYILVFNSAGFVTSGIISLFIAIFMFHIQWQRITMSDIIHQIKEGSTVFFSSAFINVFNNSYILILGLFLNESLIGIYSGVDKVIKAAKMVVDPISNALFPHIARNFMGKSNQENVNSIFHYSKVVGMLLFAITLAIAVMAPWISDNYLKNKTGESVMLIYMMSPLIITGGLNYILGMVGLINLGCQKEWLKNLIISSVLGVFTLLASVRMLGLTAAPVSSMITEGTLMAMSIISLLKIKKRRLE